MIGAGPPALLVLAMLLATRAGASERTAVLVVDTELDGATQGVAAAAAVRAKLRAAGLDVLDDEATRASLRAHLSRGGAHLAAYQARLAEAEAALAALDQHKVAQILETLVTDLAADQEPTVDKLALLEQARLRLASRLLGMGGKRETGHGETAEGKRALQLLIDGLRARPTLAPSPDEYPARFFTLLDGARAELAARGRGGLHVDSRPRGATVFLEGRDIGRTPLVLGAEALARGEYRLWLAMGTARSVPTRVTVGGASAPLHVDLAFDGALWPEGPGLRPVAGASIDEEMASKVGALLGVDALVLVGVDQAKGGGARALWGAALAVGGAQVPRRGAVPLDPDTPAEAAAATLAAFVTDGAAAGGVRDQPLPASVLPPARPGSVETEPAGDFPWLAVGLVSGGVLTAAVVGGIVVATVALTPKTGAYTVTVLELGGGE
ncbi:MAG: PEGA domain-containing protein [Deltaproteobacteria bacterium]|nr:PEGA domain-containing protein [Deltaproteobacteria bacterium]